MKTSVAHSLDLQGRRLDYRLIESATAKHLRVRVRLDGVEVLKPKVRSSRDVRRFLTERAAWIESQLERVRNLDGVRKTAPVSGSSILLRGERLEVNLQTQREQAINRVLETPGTLTIQVGGKSPTAPIVSLENWLRRQAREEIMKLLPGITRRVRRSPRKVFVMGQRTKWGNCSAKQTLSFNWRLIMAPPHVMRYLVTHEVAHLAVPDHSTKFWLTVRSLCPDSDRARQWLLRHTHELMAELRSIVHPQ